MLGAGLAICVAYLLVPGTAPLSEVLWLLAGVLAVAGTTAASFRVEPQLRRPWRLMVVGLALWVLGDTVYGLPTLIHAGAGIGFLADYLYVLGYPVLAAAMLGLARHRLSYRDLAFTLDALVVSGGIGLITFTSVLRPHLGDDRSFGHLLTVVGYPVGDILLLAVLVRWAALPGARSTSVRLLLAAVVTLVVADLSGSAFDLHGLVPPAFLQLAWLISYSLWGAAGLHPSATDPPPTVTAGDDGHGKLRLLAVAIAVMVPPGVLATQEAFGLPLDVWPVVTAAVVLFGLVVARMYLVLAEMVRTDDERRELQRRLQHEATHDLLTGLVNRAQALRHVDDVLGSSYARGVRAAVLFIDLDGFKRVNDTYGHAAGDEVLQLVAARVVRETPRELAARLGGDEFMVLLEDTDEHAALQVAQRLVEALHQPFRLRHEREVRIGASIGVALSDVALATDGKALMHDADLAAYRAKSAGKGRADLCDPELVRVSTERVQLEAALRRAIDDGELRAHYQPIFTVGEGLVTGYEALVRWERPDVGLVAPAGFIDVAEQSDLICEIDAWMLLRACADLATWGRESTSYVTVNISPRHLARARLVEDVVRALEAADLPASRLVLEVTESLGVDEARSADQLQALRTLGVHVAIDDFGTGYSSMSRLHELPADLLKIDRSFLDPERPGWIEALSLIIGSARAVGLRTVAEGVESPAQLALLRELGCDAAQGFHLAHPMPAQAVMELDLPDVRSSVGA
ncbi:EAL domain-containing protein [Nocardioides mangrovicus]|uniref:EAL domain-containing protein n=1 Tax=Nocardioides mangrovicus TaxID=2478913 RepID=A0A3L8NXX6_9ACTN|nr:EAL domain-containing protein [Nocardioides mangrovicus]